MEWISTKEQMPKFNKEVLLYDEFGQIGVGGLVKSDNGLVEWLCDGEWRGVTEVTHWMPLPKPPKDFNKI